MIGLDHSSVKLVPYSPQWKDLFHEEKRVLLAALGDHLLQIEHIGSTAIPGMQAKPIIDIAVAVRSESDIEKCIQPLAKIGYEYKGEYGLPGRHFFIKGKPSTHHLHVVVTGSHHWELWLLFRDYLIKHEHPATEYSDVKQALAKKFASDRPSYTKNKGAFIEEVLKKVDTRNTAPAGKSAMAKKKVVIVEDSDELREMEALLLRERGYEVFVFSDGKEGHDAILKILPDAVVLDAMLPNKTGFDICSALKSDRSYRYIPVMIATSITDGSEHDDKYWRDKSGADDFISKPFSSEEFVRRVEQLLEQAQAKQSSSSVS